MRAALFLSLLLACSSVLVADDDDLHWSVPLGNVAGWTPRPDWQANPSPTASVKIDGPAPCFAVDEPGMGMKWRMPLPGVEIAEQPYLVVRYRAENLDTTRTDYLVYLDDHVPGRDLCAIRLDEAKADGQWRTVAVDLSEITPAKTIHAIAVQAPAGPKGKARLWIDSVALAESPPQGAEVLARQTAAKKPDWSAPLAKAKWEPQPSWLSNPAPDGQHRVERAGEATVFHVLRPGCGMKWYWVLPESVSLEGRRYVSVRYRATPTRMQGDYAVCVLGKRRGPGQDYVPLVPASALVCNGRWQTLHADLRPLVKEFPAISGLAIQFQTTVADARLEIADLRLVDQPPPSPLADALDWRPAAAKPEGFQPVPLGSLANARSAVWRQRLRIADWFPQPEVTVSGVPFSLVPNEPVLATTSFGGKSELRLPCDAQASEVYLLLLAALRGEEEPAYGQGAFRAIRDVDRFRLRLEYADGTADECLPWNVTLGDFGVVAGPQLVAAAADPSKRLAAIVLCDRTKKAALAIAGATVRTAGNRLFPEALEESPPLKRVPPRSASSLLELLNVGQASSLAPEKPVSAPDLSRLVELRVDGRAVPSAEWELLPADKRPPSAAGDRSMAAARWYKLRTAEGLAVAVAAAANRDQTLSLAVRVINAGPKEHAVGLVAPRIGPYRLSDKAEHVWYLVPKRGAAFDNRPCSYRERYCGLFPVQFLDTFSPADGRGLSLRTADTGCLLKHYLLEKKDGELTLGVDYPDRTLRPGETLTAADAVLALTDGDWHRGLEAYRKWLTSWHRPLSPRKAWFREVFNFRQRFLWGLDPLYDRKTGKLDLLRAVDEARREFGGIDYLHLFDWGNCGPYGRIYGRIGDYSPYDYLQGGREALRAAIAGVQAEEVPVGLYIEAYLLEERGKLGQQHGKAWQLVRRDGSRAYWPDCTEMYVCPFVPEWREVQAATYAAKVQELGVDGMYLDEYGFAASVDCFSKDHGHPAPGYAVAGERDCTRIVRRQIEAARRGVAIYTEETPVDVTTQYQDGSFTYAMSSATATQTRVPLNLVRFAVPDFKTIEILYCDKPTGSWATGVKWVFFNGEAIWLEGPAAEWFEPETREAIRRCHAILRKHRDAFTTLEPAPLVPTQLGGVYANAFPVPGKTVYTFYNARRRTVRGEVLRVPLPPEARWQDEWHNRPATVRRDGEETVLHLELGPMDVGCVSVVTSSGKP